MSAEVARVRGTDTLFAQIELADGRVEIEVPYPVFHKAPDLLTINEVKGRKLEAYLKEGTFHFGNGRTARHNEAGDICPVVTKPDEAKVAPVIAVAERSVLTHEGKNGEQKDLANRVGAEPVAPKVEAVSPEAPTTSIEKPEISKPSAAASDAAVPKACYSRDEILAAVDGVTTSGIAMKDGKKARGILRNLGVPAVPKDEILTALRSMPVTVNHSKSQAYVELPDLRMASDEDLPKLAWIHAHLAAEGLVGGKGLTNRGMIVFMGAETATVTVEKAATFKQMEAFVAQRNAGIVHEMAVYGVGRPRAAAPAVPVEITQEAGESDIAPFVSKSKRQPVAINAQQTPMTVTKELGMSR